VIAKGACLFNLEPHECDHKPTEAMSVAKKAPSKRKRPTRKNKRKGRRR
jgi:hypothetical protein